MSLLLLLACLPSLYWSQGPGSAPALRHAGIDRLYVPAGGTAAWEGSGLQVVGLTSEELASREKLASPGITARADLASATRSPWVLANGWHFVRKSTGRFFCEARNGQAALAAAEAHAYGADTLLQIDPGDLEALGGMLAFLRQLEAMEAPPVADLGVVDDGSALLGEIMNMLVRRNLLFRVLDAASPEFRVNVKLGTEQYGVKDAADPSAFALRIRRELTDEKRAVRVYGSEVVICRLLGEGGPARLHLLNYGGREIDGLRIRVRGAHAEGVVQEPGFPAAPVEALSVSEGATEFSLSRMGVYAVVDLRGAR